MKIIALNKQASHEYAFLETFEAGISLLGSEVKSIRDGRITLKDSYAEVRGKEIFLVKCHISPYESATFFNHEPERDRKLLLHAREIKRLAGKVQERGLTLIPVKVMFSPKGRVKIELALAKGKRDYEKRDTIKKRDNEREMRAALKNRLR